MYPNDGEYVKEMAEAKRDVKIVVKPVEEEVIDLELSIEEAQFLVFVMERIGGNEIKSRRRHSRAILNALHGVVPVAPWSDKSDLDYENTERNSIYFNKDVE